MKYGFEREYFIKKKGEFCLVPNGLAADECGYLAEARSLPVGDPIEAAFMLLAAEYRLKQQAKKLKYQLVLVDTVVLSPELLRSALREHGKPTYPGTRGNLYGLDYAMEDTFSRAGVHVHFSDLEDVKHEGKVIASVPRMLNIPKIVQALDKRFANEIQEAKRIVGFYEMKGHGFEYRSLPATIDVVAVGEAIKELQL